MELEFSSKILEKLKQKHKVSTDEVFECFFNREGGFLEDTREDHKSDPPTLWFVSMTDKGRVLKVCFVPQGKTLSIKTAYEANDTESRIYKKYGKQK